MSKEVFITYSCDGPGCDSSVMTDSTFDFGPEDWFRVIPPGDSTVFDEGSLDFCSRECVHSWVITEVPS